MASMAKPTARAQRAGSLLAVGVQSASASFTDRADREPLAMVAWVVDPVDERDGVVFVGDPEAALGIGDWMVVAGAVVAGAGARLEVSGRGRQVHPVDVADRAVVVEGGSLAEHLGP